MKYKILLKKNKVVDDELQAGLTLLELIVVVAILGILLVTLIGFLNPGLQLSKASDAQRKNDITEISNSLSAYYNDHNCYPDTIPFGSEWKVGNTVYMREVPDDPGCPANVDSCYVYVTESGCSQWNVVFSKLTAPNNQDASYCSLSGISSCVPDNFTAQWACAVSGSVDCTQISSVSLPIDPLDGGSSTITPTLPVSPTSTPTPTPTPAGCPVEERNYGCSGTPARCNALPAGTGTYCSINCDGVC